ncbi:uncharacterized protein LOC144100563 [Amblyomma americanum]
MNLFTIVVLFLVQKSSDIYSAAYAFNAPASTEGRASSATCIETTLPDVFSVGKCLGPGLDLCKSETQLAQAVRLIGCTLLGAFEDLDAASALRLMRDIYVAIAMRRVRNVADFVAAFMNGRTAFLTAEEVDCEGKITIGLPNYWSKCLSPDLDGCDKSAPLNAATLQSFAQFAECIGTDIYEMASKNDIEKEFCIFINNMDRTSAISELGKKFFELLFSSKC